jgi:hypothetical protein
MYNFTFHRPTTVRQAAGLLTRNPEAKLLAGGHSLIPVMKQRLASPSALIDLSQVEGIVGVEQKGRSIVIGAMTRHADVANATVLQQALPGLAAVPGSIGDPQVRNRGTIGGSTANNDPNADYPAACLGLGATIITNKRRIAADDFFTGMFSTAGRGRDHRQGQLPDCQEGGLREVQAPGFGLCAGRRVCIQARRRHSRGGDRRRQQWRVPREIVRRGAQEAFRGEVARRAIHSGDRHEQRYSCQPRISRASRRCPGASRLGEGDGVIAQPNNVEPGLRARVSERGAAGEFRLV